MPPPEAPLRGPGGVLDYGAVTEPKLPFDRPAAGRDVTGDILGPRDASAPLRVCELVGRIKEALLDAFPATVAVVGEISNFKRHGSGHLYFSLKDEQAAIDAVMFRPDAAAVRFEPGDGLEVVAEGKVDVWDKAGRLQLYVQRLTPRGTGALELAFRQLKERLEREGLFDPARKQPIARFPRAIGVITSPTGAAIRDIARTLGRRWPAARVYLVGVRVQGEGAAEEIAEALGLLDAAAERLGIDTIILARGGGSLEDLWAFNEEPLGRAVFAAKTPVVSGVGHEVDFTICDFVADVRAATPTAAAELTTPDRGEMARRCDVLAGRMGRRLRDLLAGAGTALGGVRRSVVFRDPSWAVRSARQELDQLSGRMRAALAELRRLSERRFARAERVIIAHHPRRRRELAAAGLAHVRRDLAWALGRRSKAAGDELAGRAARLAAAHPVHRLALARQQVGALRRQLEAMSYRAALRRGYSVTRLAGGAILRRAADVAVGDRLRTELAEGKLESQVTRAPPPPAGKPKSKPDDRLTLFDTTEE